MRSYLIFILTFALIFSNFSETLKAFAYVEKGPDQILITAYVPEHISYRMVAGELEVSTNREGGLWVLDDGRSASGNILKVRIDGLELSNFVIIPKI